MKPNRPRPKRLPVWAQKSGLGNLPQAKRRLVGVVYPKLGASIFHRYRFEIGAVLVIVGAGGFAVVIFLAILG